MELVKEGKCEVYRDEGDIDVDNHNHSKDVGEDKVQWKGEFFYAVVSNATQYNFTKKTSYIKDSNNQDPAGGLSVGNRLIFITE